MSEREENNELIRKIAQTLRGHTEPYREGAWEGFSAKYGTPKRRLWAWPYWSAAAALLLTVGIYQLNRGPAEQVPDRPVATTQPTSVPGPSERVAEHGPLAQEPATGDRRPATPESTVGERRPTIRANVDQRREQPQLARVAEVTTQNVIDNQATTTVSVAEMPVLAEQGEQAVAVAAEAEMTEPLAPIGELTQEAYAAVGKVEVSVKKWDLGLAVSPSMTSERVNMGGGIAVAYRLSNRFSLGSGVSVGQLGIGLSAEPGQSLASVERQYDAPRTDAHGFMTEPSQYKEVTSISSNVLALDIPIDLRYHITEGFYTSVGISFLTILNEQRTNHFVDRINRPTFEQSNSTNKDLAMSVQAVYSSERAASEPLEGRGYTGFVNFSIGRKVPLSRKLSISVEPYFKLPVGSLSREEMDFTNGGIRIVTGF